jgi:hypothetical protein
MNHLNSHRGVIARPLLHRSGFLFPVIGCLLFAAVPISLHAAEGYPDGPENSRDGTTVWLTDHVRLPPSRRGGSISNFSPPPDFANQLARVNFLRPEPSNAPSSTSRVFVNDLNRNLQIMTTDDREFTPYINFQSVFPKFDNDPGYAGGLITFAFDPDYAANGRFYTVHSEDPNLSGSAVPINTHLAGFNVAGYAVTPVINPPAGSSFPRQAVLVEWTDTQIENATFEGTARELLRVGFNSNIHPMGDLIFNPLAGPDDPDYRNLYIANGDGGAGEQSDSRHTLPQRLDALPGKILRITPDIDLRPEDELSANGRYRIPVTGPNPNPFAGLTLSGLHKEIYALGFRNPHRVSWDVESAALFVNDIGLHSWEEVNIVHPGINYGYAEREGTEELFIGGANNRLTGGQINPPEPFPDPDLLTVDGIGRSSTPNYPVAQYSHHDGDAISSGFVYRGDLMPSLRRKYIFGDITTARLFYADLDELLAADDNVRLSLATVHEIQVVFDSPYDEPDQGPVNRRLFDIIAREYTERGGSAPGGAALPGGADVTNGNDPDGVPYGRGRADIRLALGADGEIHVLSKSDGVIRLMAGVLEPPEIQSIDLTDNTVMLNWRSFPGRSYRVQSASSLTDPDWTDLPGDVDATGTAASKEDAIAEATRYYRVRLLP